MLASMATWKWALAISREEKAAPVGYGPIIRSSQAEPVALLDWVMSRVVVSEKCTNPLSRT
ncbi:MAG: hypothetical protein R2874_07875 [Desulfobacterales bacterium]